MKLIQTCPLELPEESGKHGDQGYSEVQDKTMQHHNVPHMPEEDSTRSLLLASKQLLSQRAIALRSQHWSYRVHNLGARSLQAWCRILSDRLGFRTPGDDWLCYQANVTRHSQQVNAFRTEILIRKTLDALSICSMRGTSRAFTKGS